jgi:hypothetical protein
VFNAAKEGLPKALSKWEKRLWNPSWVIVPPLPTSGNGRGIINSWIAWRELLLLLDKKRKGRLFSAIAIWIRKARRWFRLSRRTGPNLHRDHHPRKCKGARVPRLRQRDLPKDSQ